MYRKNLGYSGELDAFSVYTAYLLWKDSLLPLLGVSYTSYKLYQDDDKNSLVSVIAGANVRPWRTLSFDLQGQYMNNKIYQNDLPFVL
jgi:muconolactone delta-isomerase